MMNFSFSVANQLLLMFRKDSLKSNNNTGRSNTQHRQSVNESASSNAAINAIDMSLTHSKSSPNWQKRNSNPDLNVVTTPTTNKLNQSPSRKLQQRRSVMLTHSRDLLLENSNKRLSVNIDHNNVSLLLLSVLFLLFCCIDRFRCAVIS
jgi:Ulp1 family protease